MPLALCIQEIEAGPWPIIIQRLHRNHCYFCDKVRLIVFFIKNHMMLGSIRRTNDPFLFSGNIPVSGFRHSGYCVSKHCAFPVRRHIAILVKAPVIIDIVLCAANWENHVRAPVLPFKNAAVDRIQPELFRDSLAYINLQKIPWQKYFCRCSLGLLAVQLPFHHHCTVKIISL